MPRGRGRDLSSFEARGIIFDTSFLLEAIKTPGAFTSMEELFGDLSFYVPESVVDELRRISNRRRGVKPRRARLVLNYIEKGRFKTLESKSDKADTDIQILATEGRYIVATGDSRLRESLAETGVKVIYLKDGYPHIV